MSPAKSKKKNCNTNAFCFALTALISKDIKPCQNTSYMYNVNICLSQWLIAKIQATAVSSKPLLFAL